MAFFKLRKAAGEHPAPPPAPESVDALRRRARYRLAGAAILVLAGVIGFPLLFDNQPRPIAVDIPIDIPDKAKVKPLVAGNPVAESKPAEVATQSAAAPAMAPASAPVAAALEAAAVGSTSSKVAAAPVTREAKPPAKEQQKEETIISPAKPATSPTLPKSEEKAAAKTEAKSAEKKADKPADAVGRFIVQFGAFTDSAHAHEARLQVEKTGLKTYAQIAETPEGKKFRVRVGPFDKRSDAEKAAEKIKKIGLPAAILGL
jgi:DedD protein